MKLQLCFTAVIEQCILTAGVNCLRIDIDSSDAMRAQFCGGNGKYARTTAVIQNIISPAQVFVKPSQAKLSRGMTARAKSQARIEYQVHGVWIGYLMPAWDYPQARGYPDGTELSLSSSDPILLFHACRAIAGRERKPSRIRRSVQNGRYVRCFIE